MSNAVSKLSAIIEKSPIDWDAFDSALMGLEDINVYDEKYEETILSELIMDGNFYNRGFILPDVVRHFLACGYHKFKALSMKHSLREYEAEALRLL